MMKIKVKLNGIKVRNLKAFVRKLINDVKWNKSHVKWVNGYLVERTKEGFEILC